MIFLHYSNWHPLMDLSFTNWVQPDGYYIKSFWIFLAHSGCQLETWVIGNDSSRSRSKCPILLSCCFNELRHINCNDFFVMGKWETLALYVLVLSTTWFFLSDLWPTASQAQSCQVVLSSHPSFIPFFLSCLSYDDLINTYIHNY